MRNLLNLLGAVLVVLLVVLRRSFTAIIERPWAKDDRRRPWFRATLLVTAVAAMTFVGTGLWLLATGGYLAVALLLVAFLGLLVNVLRREAHALRTRAKRP